MAVKESEARLFESMGEGKTYFFFKRADPSTCPHVHRERFCKKGETDKADKKGHEVRNQVLKMVTDGICSIPSSLNRGRHACLLISEGR